MGRYICAISEDPDDKIIKGLQCIPIVQQLLHHSDTGSNLQLAAV